MSKRRDLYVLVADEDQRRVIETLLVRRRRALGIQEVDYRVEKHPQRDAGVFKNGPKFLNLVSREFSRAIIILDAQFGRDPQPSASELKADLAHRIDTGPWEQKPLVLVIQPELEAWVWSNSPRVGEILGMRLAQIRETGAGHGFWSAGSAKPERPKELLELIVRRTKGRGPAPAEFVALAERVGVDRCSDPAFCELRDTLRNWFGPRM